MKQLIITIFAALLMFNVTNAQCPGVCPDVDQYPLTNNYDANTINNLQPSCFKNVTNGTVVVHNNLNLNNFKELYFYGVFNIHQVINLNGAPDGTRQVLQTNTSPNQYAAQTYNKITMDGGNTIYNNFGILVINELVPNNTNNRIYTGQQFVEIEGKRYYPGTAGTTFVKAGVTVQILPMYLPCTPLPITKEDISIKNNIFNYDLELIGRYTIALQSSPDAQIWNEVSVLTTNKGQYNLGSKIESFYRLKYVSEDGVVSYSKVLKTKSENKANLSYKLFDFTGRQISKETGDYIKVYSDGTVEKYKTIK